MPTQLQSKINEIEERFRAQNSDGSNSETSKFERIPLSLSYFPQDPSVSVYQVVFPVFKIDEYAKPLELIGSCCAIGAGGLFISAAHLFKPFSDLKHEREKPDIFRKRFTYQQDELRVGVCKFQKKDSAMAAKILPVQDLNLFTEHDIALFWVQEGEMPPRNQPRLAICENPKLGQNIKIIGYPGVGNAFAPQDERNKAVFASSLVESNGIITNFFPTGRDHGHAWFPCIETSARMAAGHSGGAAIDFSIPALIGTNSVSGDENSSLVSWVAKILDEEIGVRDLIMTRSDGVQVKLDKTTLRSLATIGASSIV